MSGRKFVALEEAIDLLLGDDNVCSEQAMVIFLPEQGNGCATALEQGVDIARRQYQMMLLDRLRSVETHLVKNMLLPRPATALAPAKEEKQNPCRRLQT